VALAIEAHEVPEANQNVAASMTFDKDP